MESVENEDQLVQQVHEVYLERKATLEDWGLLDATVLKADLDLVGSLAKLANRADREVWAPLAVPDPAELKDPLDSRVKRVTSVCQDPQADRELTALAAPQDPLAWLVIQEDSARTVALAQKDPQAQVAHVVYLARLASKASLDPLAQKDPQVLKASREPRERLVALDPLDGKVQRDPAASRDQLERQESEARMAKMEVLDDLVPLDAKDLPVPLVRVATREDKVHLDPLEKRADKVPRVTLEKQDFRARTAHLEEKEEWVLLDALVLPDLLV